MTHSLTGLGTIAFARQKNALGFSYTSYPRSFVSSGNGNSGGTTIVSTGLAAYTSADSEIVGLYVGVVRAANASSGELGHPLRARVVDYVDSTGTLTVEGLGFQTATGDVFELLEPPNPWWCEHTGGSATKVTDPARTEADDTWIGNAALGGYYMVPRKTAAISSSAVRLITDFSTSTGSATCATFGASTAVGDLFEAWSWIETISGYPIDVKAINRIDRGAITGRFGKSKGSAGNVTASGTTEHIHRGPGSGRAVSTSELDLLYGSIFDVATGTGYTTDAGCTTSAIQVTSGTPAQGTGWISAGGDFFVATTTAEPIVPYPTLRTAPAAGEAITALRKYTPADALNYAISVLQWHGKQSYDHLVGGACSMKWSFERDSFAKVSANWTFADGARRTISESGTEFSRAYDPKRSTVTPRAIHDIRVVLGSVDLEATKFEIDLGADLQMKPNMAAPGNVDGIEVRNFNPVGSIVLHLDSDERSLINSAIYGKARELAFQVNNTTADPGIFAGYFRDVEILSADITDDAGGLAVTVNFQVVLDPTSDMPWFAFYMG